FVEENQVCGIELGLLRLPRCPRGADIRPIPLSGMQRLFLAADAMALEEPCDRRFAGRRTPLAQPVADLPQRQIGCRLDRLQQPIPLRLDGSRTSVAAALQRINPPTPPPPLP